MSPKIVARKSSFPLSLMRRIGIMALTLLFSLPLLVGAAPAETVQTVQIIRNGDFSQGLDHWNVNPGIDPSWSPLENGAVTLNPPAGWEDYTGTVIYQNLNVTFVGGETLTFSMDLYKTAPYLSGGPTLLVELAYVEGDTVYAGRLKYLEIEMPLNDAISENSSTPTWVERQVTIPADARKLVKLSILKESWGELVADNISLTASSFVIAGDIPDITAISAVEGSYGDQFTLTGSHFGATPSPDFPGVVSIGGSSNGVDLQSWIDTSITATINDPARSGWVYVVSDFVESDLRYAFHVTSPNYTVDFKDDDITVVKGQTAEYLIRTEFHNDFATDGGITFSIDAASLPEGAQGIGASFTPAALRNPGGILMRVDTTGVDPGDYLIHLKAEATDTEPRYRPFLLEVVTIDRIRFFDEYDGNELTAVDVTAQGKILGGMSGGLYIDAVDSRGDTWTLFGNAGSIDGSPLSIHSSNPSVLLVYPTNWGPEYYALVAGTADIVVTAADGTEGRLAVNVTLPEARITAISVSPHTVSYDYEGDFTFSAASTHELSGVGYYLTGMTDFRSTFGDNLTYSQDRTFVTDTFQLGNNDGSQEPGIFTVLLYAATGESTSYALLNMEPGASRSQIKGGIRKLDETIGEHFTLELYADSGTKAYEREFGLNHRTNFHLGDFPPGTYRLKLIYWDWNTDAELSQWYPGAESFADAEPRAFNSGETVENIFFVLTSDPTVSFSGWVRDTANQPVIGAQVEGWELTAVGGVPSPTLIGTAAADGVAGAFTLGGIPAGQMFYLSIPQPTGTDYAPVLSRYMMLGENVQALLPYRLFTNAEYTDFGNASGTGMILGRVALLSDPSQPVAGATITVQRWTPDQLYPGLFYAEATTDEDGLYMVKDVPLTDDLEQYVLYQVTASHDGYTFQMNDNNAVVPVAAGTVTEESFFATPTSDSGFTSVKVYPEKRNMPEMDTTALGFFCEIPNAQLVTVSGPGVMGIMLSPNPVNQNAWSATVPPPVGGIQTGDYTFTATFASAPEAQTVYSLTSVPATPGVATLVSPISVAPDPWPELTEPRPTFTWSPASGAQAYRLRVASQNVPQETVEYNSPWLPASATSHQPAIDLPTGPQMYWYVLAYNGSDWPSTSAMSISTEQPFSIAAAPTDISFSGRVTDSQGIGVDGAMVMMAGNPALHTTTGTNGAFTLSGLPMDTGFALRIAKEGFLPVFSALMRSDGAIDSSAFPFVLFTPTEISGSIEGDTGVIMGRVLDRSSGTGTAVSGAVVTYTSMLGEAYTVVYPGSTGQSTGIEGRYMIPNVVDGDRVIVTATYPGNVIVFDGRVFPTHGNAVSQGHIFGTSDGAILALRNTFDAAMTAFNAKNLVGFMGYVSNEFLDEGQDKTGFAAELSEEFSDPDFTEESYVVLGSFVDGSMGRLTVLWNDVERDEIIFRNEAGAWKLYGNQALFEIMARSGHQLRHGTSEHQYWISLEVEDPGEVATSVTVTGDGIIESITLYYDVEEGRWNSWHKGESPMWPAHPELPLTYTFTVNYGDDQQVVETVGVRNFVEVFPENPSPAEGQTVSGDLVFSWTPVPGFTHGIELYRDGSWDRLWDKYDLRESSVSYDGPDLDSGAYVYNIGTNNNEDNYSLLQVSFQYAAVGPVPDLAQAITVLKVLAGLETTGDSLSAIRDVNGNGTIGFAELLYILQTNAGLRNPLPEE